MRLTRYRLRAFARPARRWAVGVALASVTFAVVHGAVDRAEAARRRWGTARALLVAARDLQPGDALDDGAVREANRPDAVVADDALAPGERTGAERLAVPVLAGEAVRRAHLAAAGRGVADGRRAVAVPRPAGLALAPGDRVDVIDAAAGAVVATGGVVVRVDAQADAVEVSVDAAAVGALSRALADGRVVVVRTGD